jgi:hypothetical protein
MGFVLVREVDFCSLNPLKSLENPFTEERDLFVFVDNALTFPH